MNTIISIHIFPHEIGGYRRVMNSLANSIKHLDKNTSIEIWSTLNKNPQLISQETPDSELTKISQQFINLNKSSIVNTKFTISTSKTIHGVNEHRRETITGSKSGDNIIFLDCDLHFNERLLSNQISAIYEIRKKTQYYIITPQIIRLWDSTWDCLVHPDYKKCSFDFHKTANAKSLVKLDYGDVSITKNETFKWGGGWFNVISADLLKYIGLPDSFIGYGPDDTFAMKCCQLMKPTNKKVQQYILNNMVVIEDKSPPKSKVKLKTNLPNYREMCTQHFQKEVAHFTRKL